MKAWIPRDILKQNCIQNIVIIDSSFFPLNQRQERSLSLMPSSLPPSHQALYGEETAVLLEEVCKRK